MTKPIFVGLLLCGLALGRNAHGDVDFSSQGELGTEGRVFLPGVDGKPANLSGIGRLTIDGKSKPFKLRLRGFVRHDGFDRKRSALFPEEAFLEYKKKPFRVRLGYQLLNWSATEAFHPADIINSRYLDGNVQSPEKLGELMAATRYKFWEGNVEAYFMPFFTKPIFPSEDSRFRFGPEGLAIGSPIVLNRNGELDEGRFFPQFGARVQQTIRDADVSLHVVHHIDRGLPLVLVRLGQGGELLPQLVFQQVTQIGGTYQKVWEPVIVKVEAAYKDFDDPSDAQRSRLPMLPEGLLAVPDRDHGQVALGLEYSKYHKDAQSTFLLEGQYAIGFDREANEGALLLFDRDLLLGYRLAMNDEDDKSLTASVIVDVVNPDQVFANIMYGQRLGETWRISAGFRAIKFRPKDRTNPQGPENLDDANYFYSSLIRYF